MLRYALRLTEPKVLGEMLNIANKHASAEDDARGHDGINIDNVGNAPRKGNFQQKKKHNNDDKEVVVAFGNPGQDKGGNNNSKGGKWKGKAKVNGDHVPRQPNLTYAEAKDKPCIYHSQSGKVNHTTKQCRFIDEAKKDPEAGYKKKNFQAKE